ncbi:AzlC family ABC transporter permease [Microvirga sp. W0021]|uniref:AzlC family ABC transporter permease n=1 Tax=Hohaiivirga grylli TaxID=3133970 RepID=A0ABV0BKV5_9HYPH
MHSIIEDEDSLGQTRSYLKDDIIPAFRDIWPLSVAMIPIAMLFGALASGKGFSLLETFLMSFLVFAGSSQFAALELWQQPIPVLAILFSTLLINARHMLMGLSIGPKLVMSKPLRWIAVYFMSDEIWAVAEKRAQNHQVTAAYWFTLIAIFPTTWFSFSVIGALVGPLLGPPERIGADFAFTAVFIALVTGFERSRTTLMTIAASAITAALSYYFLGSPWHIMIGAFCGIIVAYLFADTGEGENVAA